MEQVSPWPLAKHLIESMIPVIISTKRTIKTAIENMPKIVEQM